MHKHVYYSINTLGHMVSGMHRGPRYATGSLQQPAMERCKFTALYALPQYTEITPLYTAEYATSLQRFGTDGNSALCIEST